MHRLASSTLVAVALLAAPACGVADFDVSQPIAEQQVQGSPLPGQLSMVFPFPLSLDISAEIAARHTGPIDSVTLGSLSISITATDRPSGDTDDLGFIDSVDVYVSSTKQGTTLPKVKIASLRSPGAVATAAFVIEPDVNLDPYINEGSAIDTTSSGTAPPDDVSFDGEATFVVHPL